ncbi:MAG: hypothetical protein P1U40_01205 [Coxiellaceae bacterium]|nr:hypothetical protein [Coxiellaceae bacterium]
MPQPNQQRYLPLILAIIIGAIAAILFGYAQHLAISRSTISTASIGYVTLPIICLFIFIIFGACGWLIGTAIEALINQSPHRMIKFLSAIITPAVFAAVIITYTQAGYDTEASVNKTLAMNSAQLEQAFDTYKTPDLYNFYLFKLAAIAQNNHASPKLLHQIASLNDDRLNNKLGSLFNVNGKNAKGLSVYRLIVLNPKATAATLQLLAQQKNDHLLGNIAANHKTPVPLLRKLNKKGGYLIEWGLSYNKNTPTDILTQLSKSTNKYTRYYIALNPSTPAAVLKILSKDKDKSTQRAAQNNLRRR